MSNTSSVARTWQYPKPATCKRVSRQSEDLQSYANPHRTRALYGRHDVMYLRGGPRGLSIDMQPRRCAGGKLRPFALSLPPAAAEGFKEMNHRLHVGKRGLSQLVLGRE